MTMKLLPAIGAAVLISACSAPQASADTTAPQRTITVSGEGSAAQAPDMAIINIGVTTEAKTPGDALSKNNVSMNALLASLKKAKIEGKDVQTSGLSINPVYSRSQSINGSNRRTISGYRVSNTVTARIRDLDKAGDAIDAAVQSGANTLNNISFVISEPEPLLNKARAQAVKNARSKAELLADSAGVKLGPLMNLSESGSYQPRPYAATMRAEMADASLPIEAGESVLTARVNLVYAID